MFASRGQGFFGSSARSSPWDANAGGRVSGGGRFVSDNGAEQGAAAAPPVAHYQAPRVAPPPRSTRPAPRPRARDPPRVHAPASGTVNRRSIYGASAGPAGAARRSTVPAQRGSGSSSTRFVPTRSVGARGSRRQDDPSPVSDEAIDVRVLPRRVVLRATDWGPVLPSPGLTSCHGVCGSCCACPRRHVMFQYANKSIFGHDSFRTTQRQVIKQALRKQDVFVIMPTGGGKSLCYQVATTRRTRHRPRVACPRSHRGVGLPCLGRWWPCCRVVLPSWCRHSSA